MEAVLNDYQTAPIEEKLKRLLAFLEKLTLHPNQVTPNDIAPLKEVGLTDREIEGAMHVTAVFNIDVRLADALGYDLPTEAVHDASAQFLLQKGYIL